VPLSERFAFGMSMAVGVQAEAMSGIDFIEIVGVRIQQTNIETERNIIIDLVIDGNLYEVFVKFKDETFANRTLVGKPKQRTGI